MKTHVNTRRYIFVVFALILCFGCTVSKRHYRKGFYISRTSARTPGSPEKRQKTVQRHRTDTSSGVASITDPPLNSNAILLASAEKTTVAMPGVKYLKALNDSCGDVITFRDGSDQYVKVVEASDDFIKYKPCNNLDGPIRTTTGEYVFMIKYLDGRKRVYREKAVIADARASTVKRNNGFAVASFICSLMSIFFVPAVPALLFGLIGLAQINRDSEKYKGRWMAIMGIIIGGIMSLLFLILLAWS